MNKRMLLVSTLVLLAIGCSEAPPATDAQSAQQEIKSEETASAAKSAETPSENSTGKVTIQFANWEETQKKVAAHRGKVVVLDIWSTWCAPCMEEFPNLVKLQQSKKDTVVCMSLNCNYAGFADEPPESAKPDVERFLEKQNATFENLISTDSDEKLFEKLEIASIPAVFVYDRDGNLAKKFINDDGEYGEEGFTYAEHILPFVESLTK